jgi:hypothetical protein
MYGPETRDDMAHRLVSTYHNGMKLTEGEVNVLADCMIQDMLLNLQSVNEEKY